LVENNGDDAPSRPAHNTIFDWVNFACKRIESTLMQFQKELVQETKRGKGVAKWTAESILENPNSYKAASAEKDSLLDRLSFATGMANTLLRKSTRSWYGVRAYFLTRAETRKDLLTDTGVKLPITQTFELTIL